VFEDQFVVAGFGIERALRRSAGGIVPDAENDRPERNLPCFAAD